MNDRPWFIWIVESTPRLFDSCVRSISTVEANSLNVNVNGAGTKIKVALN